MGSEKVVMVIAQFYPLLGGAEIQAQKLAAALRARGVEIFVLTRRIKNAPAYESVDGIPVYRSIRSVNVPLLFGVLYVISVAWFLYKRRNEYSIIHCHILQEYQTFVALVFKLLFNKKVIAKMSSSGPTSDVKLMKNTLAGRVTIRLMRNADRIISLCSQSTSELLEEGMPADRVAQIANGVDTSRFTISARRSNNRKMITFIGRLDGYKGVDCLLGAFRQVIQGCPDVTLKLVGDGPDAMELTRQAEALQIQGRVVFRGRQVDVAKELSETDIFVLPSLSEGMSNVLLEAMACGLPVVATEVGAAADMISNRVNGMLVPPGNPAALSNALIELLRNDVFAGSLGIAARKTVEERYGLERTADCYEKLYRRLLIQSADREIRV